VIALKILGSVKEKGLERANFRSGPHPVSAALREGRKASDQDRRDVRFPANPRGGFPRPSSFPGSRRSSPEKENPQPLVFGCGFPLVITGTNEKNRAHYPGGGVSRTPRPACLIL